MAPAGDMRGLTQVSEYHIPFNPVSNGQPIESTLPVGDCLHYAAGFGSPDDPGQIYGHAGSESSRRNG